MNQETLQKLKMISLVELRYAPLADVRRFKPSQKKQLIALIEHKFATMSPEQIAARFNEIVCEEVLHNEADVSKYLVYENVSA